MEGHKLSLFLFCLVSTAAGAIESAVVPPSKVDPATNSCQLSTGSLQMQRLATLGCTSEFYLKSCDQFFDSAEDAKLYGKCSSSNPGDSSDVDGLDLILVCAQQTYAPLTDAVTAVAGAMISNGKNNLAYQANFLKMCADNSEMKRTFARTLPFFHEWSDHAIDQFSCEGLIVEMIEFSTRFMMSRKSEKAAEIADAYIRSSKISFSGPSENPLRSFIEKNAEKFECLNAAGRTRMLCYGFFSVFDPTIAVGGAALKYFSAVRAVSGSARASRVVSQGAKDGVVETVAVAVAEARGSQGAAATSLELSLSDQTARLHRLSPVAAQAFSDVPDLLFLRRVTNLLESSTAAQRKRFEWLVENHRDDLKALLVDADSAQLPLSNLRERIEQLAFEKLQGKLSKISNSQQAFDLLAKVDQVRVDADTMTAFLETAGNQTNQDLVSLARAGSFEKLGEIAKLVETQYPRNLPAIRQKIAALRRELSPAPPAPAGGMNESAASVIKANRAAEVSGFPSGYKFQRASTEDVLAVRARYQKLSENIDLKVERIRKQRLARPHKIDDISSIDFDPVYSERIQSLDPGVRKALTAIWNRMHSAEDFANYSRALAEDAAVDMAKKGIPAELDALARGEISRTAVMRVLVQRHRTQGNDRFTTVVKGVSGPRAASPRSRRNYSSQEGFEASVSQGPFFDRALRDAEHGSDIHFMQYDYVSDVIAGATNGQVKEFWKFFGSKDGIGYWNHLMDAGDYSWAQPEILKPTLNNFLNLK